MAALRPQEGEISVLPLQTISGGGSVDCYSAMRAASPPREERQGPGDVEEDKRKSLQYGAWKEDHPSALEHFPQLIDLAEGKKLAIFLDYDGTLSPIVEDPDEAFMSDAMRATVKRVASHFPTAIITGRRREKVYGFVQLSELYYAGSHGMDIMGPRERHRNGCSSGEVGEALSGASASCTLDEEGNDAPLFQPAREYFPMINEVFETLQRRTADVDGALIENNKFCVTIHFRRVSEERWATLADIVADVLKGFPKLRATHGRKVLEIRPIVDWDKGKALTYLLRTLGLDQGGDVLPLYIGDDRTDEDAFMVLREAAVAGCGILVSTVAKDTRAAFSLRDPSEVMTFLSNLVEWQERSNSRNGRRSNCNKPDCDY
eukprot:TRINITY_DN13684_c0_g1_i1.p1 TRINITY_DN13684_c0_g1~~TRINITY_DN13684_c0_g1_i1.p1  ORF type:complete len:375 (-),score=68.76 TRINITY_DN13684_c0_g1_i1:1398-2522(-)